MNIIKSKPITTETVLVAYKQYTAKNIRPVSGCYLNQADIM